MKNHFYDWKFYEPTEVSVEPWANSKLGVTLTLISALSNKKIFFAKNKIFDMADGTSDFYGMTTLRLPIPYFADGCTHGTHEILQTSRN